MNMSWAFQGCSSLTELDLSGFETSSVMNMSNMFGGCSSLVSLDLSNFKTGSVMDMSDMFMGCTNLKVLDVSNEDFRISEDSEHSNMFVGCDSLTTIIVSQYFDLDDETENEVFDDGRGIVFSNASNNGQTILQIGELPPIAQIENSSAASEAASMPDSNVLEIPTLHLTMKRGDQGIFVKGLQYHLIIQNYLYDVADGSFGANTEEAVMQLQADAGLPATGIVDDAFNAIWTDMQRSFVPQANDQLMMILERYESEDNMIHITFRNMGRSTVTGFKFNVYLTDADYTKTGAPKGMTPINQRQNSSIVSIPSGAFFEATFNYEDLHIFKAGDYMCLELIEFTTEDGIAHAASQEKLYAQILQ